MMMMMMMIMMITIPPASFIYGVNDDYKPSCSLNIYMVNDYDGEIFRESSHASYKYVVGGDNDDEWRNHVLFVVDDVHENPSCFQ